MSSYYWIKLYHEILDDPKMGRLPDNLWRRFFECCLMAGEENHNGRLPRLPDIAWRLRIEEETLKTEFDQLVRIGLLDYVSSNPLDEHWTVTNYAKRQAPISAAERMRNMRDTKKKREYYEDGDEDVTKRNTDIDIESDIDIELELDTNYHVEFSELTKAYGKLRGGYFSQLESDLIAEYVEEWQEILSKRPSGHNDKKYTPEWVILQAIKETAKAENPTLKYTEGVLRNWKRNGIKAERKHKNGNAEELRLPKGL